MYGVLVFNVDKCVAWCGFVGLDGVGYLVKYFVVVSYAKPFYLLVSALDTKCVVVCLVSCLRIMCSLGRVCI